jgi:hypothetical protein
MCVDILSAIQWARLEFGFRSQTVSNLERRLVAQGRGINHFSRVRVKMIEIVCGLIKCSNLGSGPVAQRRGRLCINHFSRF